MGLRSEIAISPEVLGCGSTKNIFGVLLILCSCCENFSSIALETKKLENLRKVTFW